MWTSHPEFPFPRSARSHCFWFTQVLRQCIFILCFWCLCIIFYIALFGATPKLHTIRQNWSEYLLIRNYLIMGVSNFISFFRFYLRFSASLFPDCHAQILCLVSVGLAIDIIRYLLYIRLFYLTCFSDDSMLLFSAANMAVLSANVSWRVT